MKPLEKNTNQLYRQKYFVDETHVIRYRPPPAMKGASKGSPVIAGSHARLASVKIPMHEPPPPADAQIAVELVRDGDTITGIRIQCPCGRHAELDFEHDSPSEGEG